MTEIFVFFCKNSIELIQIADSLCFRNLEDKNGDHRTPTPVSIDNYLNNLKCARSTKLRLELANIAYLYFELAIVGYDIIAIACEAMMSSSVCIAKIKILRNRSSVCSSAFRDLNNT
ncbi:hypothetical protein V1478_002938 [Vespula squamosa]|uniref:Uncharacterized protein n=1 Tax=Vespula squamosa TaxID=30214 RepID=A0ABD2BR95_VESSQ